MPIWTPPGARRALLSLLLGIGFASSAVAQNAVPVRQVVLIDPGRLTEPQRAAAVRALVRLSPVSTWETVTVVGGEGLYNVINRQYRYYDSQYPATVEALATEIANANRLGRDRSLVAGAPLLVPPLPKRPYERGASAQFSQVLRAGGEVFTTRTSEAVGDLAPPPPPLPEERERLGATWLVDVDSASAVAVRDSIPVVTTTDLRTPIYVGPSIETADLNPLSTQNGSAPDAGEGVRAILQQVAADAAPIRALPPGSFGRFHILDTFRRDPAGCSHGDAVFDVARRTLASAVGEARSSEVLEKHDLDFFEDAGNARRVIERYARTFTQDIERQLLDWLKEVEKRRPPKKEKAIAVPLLYVQALNHDIATSRSSSAASISYWTYANGFQWLPPTFTEGSEMVLLAAAMNDDPSFVEDDRFNNREPLRSFFDRRDRYGVVLVGAARAQSAPFGMRSRSGDGITAVGMGAGWFTDSKCPGYDIGTSLATPFVGALLVAAKGFWRNGGESITAAEAKRRLLQSIDVETGYVGLYGAPGLPRLAKLLWSQGAYLQRRDGTLVAASFAPTSHIEVSGPFGVLVHPLGPGSGFGVSAFAVDNGRVFALLEHAIAWRELSAPVLRLEATIDGQKVSISSISEFERDFKGAGHL